MRKLLLSSIALSVLLPNFVLAEEATAEKKDNSSETVIVIGQRETPITVKPRGLAVSLNKEDFEAINAINVEDLMKYAPNFYVRKRFAGDDNAVVALRGANTTQSARVIVMVDGFLVSNFLGNTFSTPPKWNVVGPSEVRQFDIVYGPYSARYGGNSMGGIVSVTTQEPKKNSGYLAAQYTAHPFKEYGNDATYTGYNIEGGANWKQKDGPLSARISFRHFDSVGQPMSYSALSSTTGTGTSVTGVYNDPRLTSPLVFGSASPGDVVQDQVRGRIGIELGGDWKFDLLALGWRTEQKQEKPESFLKDASGNIIGNGRVVYDGKTYNANGLVFSNFNRDEYLIGGKLQGTFKGWQTRTNLSRYIIPVWESRSSTNYATGSANGSGTLTQTDNPSWWALDNNFEQVFGKHKIAIGFNANLYETYQNNYSVANWRSENGKTFTTASGGKTNVWGIYAEDEIKLNEDTILTLGARFDEWNAKDGVLSTIVNGNRVDRHFIERNETSFSPKASIQAYVTENWLVQLSVGSAVRFPTVGELYGAKFKDNIGTIDNASFDPFIKPEKSTDISLLARSNFGPFRVTSSFFFQDIKDAIVSFAATTPNEAGVLVSGYQNIDYVTQYGAEIIADAKDFIIDGLDVDFSVTRMEARTIRNTANPLAENVMLPRIPKWRANGNIRYKISPSLKANLGWRYADRPNSDLFGLVRGDAYGYQTEYFYIDTRITWDINKNVKWGFGIDNINNDHGYVSHPMPRTTYVTDIKYTW